MVICLKIKFNFDICQTNGQTNHLFSTYLFYMNQIGISFSMHIRNKKRKRYYLFGEIGYSGFIILTWHDLNDLKEKFEVFSTTMEGFNTELKKKIDSICNYRKFGSLTAETVKNQIPNTYEWSENTSK